MPRWPIRIKLIAGLTLVVGMMLTLLGGALYGLRSFHAINLALTNQLRELGASKKLLELVVSIDGSRLATPSDRAALADQVRQARGALSLYFEELRVSRMKGDRADDGHDELDLAYQIDGELTAILAALEPAKPVEPVLKRTGAYLRAHAATQGTAFPAGASNEAIYQRIERLNGSVLELPDKLHRDFYALLTTSKQQYQSSRIIVWSAATTVVAMLCGLAVLLHQWVLYPVRLLHRGVKRVARGAFNFRIHLETGDEMQGLAEAFNDMTARLGAMYHDLEIQVQERSRLLVRSERLAGVGFLAAGVAHEINNPLASIAFCAEAMENRLRSAPDTDGDAKVVKNYLRMIQDEAFRCKRITEKLLDFARCSEIQRERTDVVGLIQNVVEMVQHMGKYRGKDIVFQPREAVMAHVDPQETKQVVLNLIVNALESMEPGGTLRIDARYGGGMAEMVFTDDGCGMDAEVMENLFEPFFTKRKSGKGTGLGLSITHRIVSQHQGEITASSPGPGLGATFKVRLPTHAGAATPTPRLDDSSSSGEMARVALSQKVA